MIKNKNNKNNDLSKIFNNKNKYFKTEYTFNFGIHTKIINNKFKDIWSYLIINYPNIMKKYIPNFDYLNQSLKKDILENNFNKYIIDNDNDDNLKESKISKEFFNFLRNNYKIGLKSDFIFLLNNKIYNILKKGQKKIILNSLDIKTRWDERKSKLKTELVYDILNYDKNLFEKEIKRIEELIKEYNPKISDKDKNKLKKLQNELKNYIVKNNLIKIGKIKHSNIKNKTIIFNMYSFRGKKNNNKSFYHQQNIDIDIYINSDDKEELNKILKIVEYINNHENLFSILYKEEKLIVDNEFIYFISCNFSSNKHIGTFGSSNCNYFYLFDCLNNFKYLSKKALNNKNNPILKKSILEESYQYSSFNETEKKMINKYIKIITKSIKDKFHKDFHILENRSKDSNDIIFELNGKEYHIKYNDISDEKFKEYKLIDGENLLKCDKIKMDEDIQGFINLHSKYLNNNLKYGDEKIKDYYENNFSSNILLSDFMEMKLNLKNNMEGKLNLITFLYIYHLDLILNGIIHKDFFKLDFIQVLFLLITGKGVGGLFYGAFTAPLFINDIITNIKYNISNGFYDYLEKIKGEMKFFNKYYFFKSYNLQHLKNNFKKLNYIFLLELLKK